MRGDARRAANLAVVLASVLVLALALAGGAACTGGLARADEGVPAPGRAADLPPLSITWDAPPGCPDAEVVRAAVRRWVTLTPDRIEHAGVEAMARVDRVEGGWQLDLTLVSPGGRQRETLVSERCDTFVELVALKVALTVDPEALLRGLDADRRARPVRDDAGSPWTLRGAFGLGVGLLPGAAESVAALGGYERGAWRVELGAELWFPRPATYPSPPNVGASLSLVAGEARACALPALGGVTFPVCGGAEVGEMAGEGFNVSDVKTSRQLWAALTFGPAVRFRVAGPVFFWLEGEVLVALTRPAFHVRNLPQLYEATPASGRGWAGLEWRFGAE